MVFIIVFLILLIASSQSLSAKQFIDFLSLIFLLKVQQIDGKIF